MMAAEKIPRGSSWLTGEMLTKDNIVECAYFMMLLAA